MPLPESAGGVTYAHLAESATKLISWPAHGATVRAVLSRRHWRCDKFTTVHEEQRPRRANSLRVNCQQLARPWGAHLCSHRCARREHHDIVKNMLHAWNAVTSSLLARREYRSAHVEGVPQLVAVTSSGVVNIILKDRIEAVTSSLLVRELRIQRELMLLQVDCSLVGSTAITASEAGSCHCCYEFTARRGEQRALANGLLRVHCGGSQCCYEEQQAGSRR